MQFSSSAHQRKVEFAKEKIYRGRKNGAVIHKGPLTLQRAACVVFWTDIKSGTRECLSVYIDRLKKKNRIFFFFNAFPYLQKYYYVNSLNPWRTRNTKILILPTADFIKKALGVYTRSMETIYLSLRARTGSRWYLFREIPGISLPIPIIYIIFL